MTVTLERTLAVSLPAAESAGIHHSDVTNREVEFHRIDRIQLAQMLRDVGGHLPARARIARQPQALREADDVSIEWNDQLSRTNRPPDAQVHLIVAHHPAQVQVEPLAGASRGWPRKEVAHAGAFRHAAIDAPHVERQGAARE